HASKKPCAHDAYETPEDNVQAMQISEAKPETHAAEEERIDKLTSRGRGRPKGHYLPKKCPECGKTFANIHLLTGHLFLHSGEKPLEHRCPYPDCGASSDNLHNLLRHRDRVHGEHNLEQRKINTKKHAQDKQKSPVPEIHTPLPESVIEEEPYTNEPIRHNPSLHELWALDNRAEEGQNETRPGSGIDERPEIPLEFMHLEKPYLEIETPYEKFFWSEQPWFMSQIDRR
ncbi:C2H2-type zinc finger protein, partial [Methylicorpusculum sp.]|uniref:C2H2-type zinc finger protein n=1 Tax=Methylicorpusculum sp. TaxID=2713644 RepID=UPI002ABA0541